MNNVEKILKYLSDNLSHEEKNKIGIELNNSEELRSEFDKMNNILLNLKNESNVEIDDRYFSNLAPNVRSRMEKKKQFLTIPRLAILMPLIAVVLVVTFTINSNMNSRISFAINDQKELLSEILDQASLNQLSDYFYINLNSEKNDFSVITDELAIDKQNLISIGENTLNTFNEYDLINYLSEEEADEIYNKLLNKKFL